MPGHEVEILAAVDVVQTRAVAAHERHRLAPVGLQHVLRFARLDVVEGHFHRTTCVQPVSDACAVGQRAEPTSAAVGDDHVADAAAAAPRGRPAAWPPCPCWPCRP